MRILVAGGAGYIGSMLVPELLDHGYEVEVIDLMWFGNHLPQDVPIIQRNLFECKEDDFKGFDQVIFLAGLSNDPMAEFNPAKNFIDNAALPAYLAFIARKAGVKRYIYASSCSVYGYTVSELYNEESPVVCAYPYGISKLQGERGVFQMCGGDSCDFSVISLRQGTICGHSPRMRFDLIVNTMFKTAMTEGVINVNNPSIWRPIYDIRDAVSAYLRAVQADSSISGVFNVTSGNYTVGQVADIIRDELKELTDRKIKLSIKDIKDFRNYKVSWEKAQTILGFMPKYGIRDMVHELYDNLSNYGDLNHPSYSNIATFKGLNF